MKELQKQNYIDEKKFSEAIIEHNDKVKEWNKLSDENKLKILMRNVVDKNNSYCGIDPNFIQIKTLDFLRPQNNGQHS